MDGQPYDPMMPENGLLNDLLHEVPEREDQHLCARCGSPITDPLEECPTCAAELGEDEGWP